VNTIDERVIWKISTVETAASLLLGGILLAVAVTGCFYWEAPPAPPLFLRILILLWSIGWFSWFILRIPFLVAVRGTDTPVVRSLAFCKVIPFMEIHMIEKRKTNRGLQYHVYHGEGETRLRTLPAIELLVGEIREKNSTLLYRETETMPGSWLNG